MSVPFCWQDKRVLRLIRENIAEYQSALAVYVALTAVASDKEAAQFQTTHEWIGSLCGFSVRTVGDRLRDLERVGAVVITPPPGPRAPQFYTLPPIGSDCRTFGNGCRTFGKGKGTSVADIRRDEEMKAEEGQSVISKPRGTADRIGLENQKRILEKKQRELRDDTSEQWQRDASPEKLAALRDVNQRIAEIEGALLA